MAKLSSLRVNASAIADGEWMEVGPADNRFEIKTRGMTAAYRDGLSALRREAARTANRGLRPGDVPTTPDSLPPSLDDSCQGQALVQFCTLDVRGLDHEEGKPVTAAELKGMLLNREEYPWLIVLALQAAQSVGAVRVTEAEDAAKNSAAGSAGI
jgi:hypothetical protein